jgi:hypothetical protein
MHQNTGFLKVKLKNSRGYTPKPLTGGGEPSPARPTVLGMGRRARGHEAPPAPRSQTPTSTFGGGTCIHCYGGIDAPAKNHCYRWHTLALLVQVVLSSEKDLINKLSWAKTGFTDLLISSPEFSKTRPGTYEIFPKNSEVVSPLKNWEKDYRERGRGGRNLLRGIWLYLLNSRVIV